MPENSETSSQSPAGRNWAGNLTYSALMAAQPRSVPELQAALSVTSGPVKFLGSRHCFNDIANTVGTMVLMNSFEPLDSSALTVVTEDGPPRVRVAGSTTYGDLAIALAGQNLALANFASLPHITIAGAIATGTHGSGNGNQPLIGSVWAFEVVTPLGDIRRAVRDGSGDLPFETGVHLGLLGALTFIEIEVEPEFQVRQDLYQGLPWEELLENFQEITGSAYSVSIFTHWHTEAAEQVWLKSRVAGSEASLAGAGGLVGANALPLADGVQRVADAPSQLTDAPETFFGATKATQKLHPLPDTDPIHCTEQLGAPGPSYDRLPHFKMGFTPSKGEELQSEYLIPREHAPAAIQAVLEHGDDFRELLFVSEIRTMRGDSGWLSPTPQDSVGIHFTWKPRQTEVEAYLPVLEGILAPFEARPHWGKLHTVSAQRIAELYPRMNDFLEVARECDPEGRLRNEYSVRVLGY